MKHVIHVFYSQREMIVTTTSAANSFQLKCHSRCRPEPFEVERDDSTRELIGVDLNWTENQGPLATTDRTQ